MNASFFFFFSNYLSHCFISDTAQQLYLFILFRKRILELTNLGTFSRLDHTVTYNQLHGWKWKDLEIKLEILQQELRIQCTTEFASDFA